MFHKRPPVFDFSPNPADRVPVHVKFKVAELFINKYGISLMTPDELKSIPKGHFIVMKTGTHPMRTRLRLFLEWGITFGAAYQVPQQAARKVYYASKAELTDIIYRAFPAPACQNNYRTPKKEETVP